MKSTPNIRLGNRSQQAQASHSAQPLRPFAPESLSKNLKILFSIERHAHALNFNFNFIGRVAADLEKLVIPGLQEPHARRRRDELWKHTCLEIFVGPASRESYLELNLSPSGDWNVYGFDGYRKGMTPVEGAEAGLAHFERGLGEDSLHWSASLATESGGRVAEILGPGPLVLGAAVVLEYEIGEREYWALVHAGEKPDFHLRESFRLPL